ncbi:glutathione S-transferase family protein [Mesorhizobium sp. B2-4-12]|uniref:glutathione S-transferase family protein n=1 Tax=unclassified Mesorhizobium TaxID=325217 RepID=UPI0011268564|nr:MULTISPECIES: glutathione S-transferase family protein [unclassified Mesorhizobium]TPK81402.1 glutathione S-transferase family protein [Mesorhizobium sp. B2-4-17]TPK89346.1 glutathione S-transferase family protein [Mesorhizobium sp. B2-4-12]
MIIFYHNPWSRASGVHWLLEELGVPFEFSRVDIRAKEGVPESYRAIQPNKKVPAIDHDGTIITERAAITIYLADTFAEAGLAPAIGDRARATYLTWLVYSDSVLDPVVAAKAHGKEFMGSRYSYGSFSEMVANLEKTLSSRPYIAGDKFTAADTQIGSGVYFATNVLRVLPEHRVFRAYMDRLAARPAFQRYSRREYEMAQAAGMLDSR